MSNVEAVPAQTQKMLNDLRCLVEDYFHRSDEMIKMTVDQNAILKKKLLARITEEIYDEQRRK